MTKLTPTEPKGMDDGKYEGTIIRLDFRSDPHDYVDVVIHPEGDSDFDPKYGCPNSTSVNGKLMRLVNNFVKVEPGVELDLEEVLVDQKVQFVIVNRPSKDGKASFANIAPDSVKPVD